MMERVPGSEASADQHVDVGRQGGQHRTGAEDCDPAQHDLLAAEHVAQRPSGQHERGKGQRVAVDDPLQRGDAGMQGALDVGQADAHHGVVQEGQEQDQAERGQGRRLGPGPEAALLDLHAGHGTGDGRRDAARRDVARRHPHHAPGRVTGPVYPPESPAKPHGRRRVAHPAPSRCDNGRRQPSLQHGSRCGVHAQGPS
jgi:hypothetical protein